VEKDRDKGGLKEKQVWENSREDG